jgi:lipoprotein signal peptidase
VKERSPFSLLFVLVLIADQVVKTLGVVLLHSAHTIQLLPGLSFHVVGVSVVYLAPDRLRLLMVGLLAVLLLYRLREHDSRAGDYAEAGTQLMAAGVLSGVADLLLWRDRIGLFVLGPAHSHLYFSVADLAVVGGMVLFAIDLVQRRRIPLEPQIPFQQSQPLVVDLERFRRGIDNVHIDVRLGADFVGRARDLISSILTPQLWWEPWRGAPPAPSKHSLREFRAAYSQVIESALHRARGQQNVALVSLAQLAALKFVLGEVRSQFDTLLREFRREIDRNPPASTRSTVRMSQHLISLQRRRSVLLESACQLLLQQIHRVETGPLAELKQSLLGANTGLPPEVLSNPVLLTDEPEQDLFLMRHYLLLGHRADDVSNVHRVEHLLLDLLGCGAAGGEERASGVVAGMVDRIVPRSRGARLGLPAGGRLTERRRLGAVAARQESCPWLDFPANAHVLLDVEHYRRQLREGGAGDEGVDTSVLAAHVRFQRYMLRRLDRELRRTGLLPIIIAAYETPEIWKSFDIPISPRTIQRYLTGSYSRAELAEKLRKFGRRTDRQLPIDQLDAAADRVAHCPVSQRQAYIHRFVSDFLRYRNDLKQARMLRSWLEQVRLLESDDDVRLSMINNSLYDLMTPADGDSPGAAPIVGHVVIKADVRGSTGMTMELVNRGLNPASHFDINFFEPIGNLVSMYGAEKVFVEGDAVIFTILEHEGDEEANLTVARACGLARSILEVVAAQNATGVRYGLPALELGIGIAYEAAPPSYLLDNNRPIMISPAISRADRLSSCAAFLRNESRNLVELAPGQRLQVFQAVGQGGTDDKKGVGAFRYNVDGIELEPAAFEKLAGEIHLQSTRLDRPLGRRSERLHCGRYPDARGVMRNLLVREGLVRRIDRREGRVTSTELPYYEVVVDSSVFKEVACGTVRGTANPAERQRRRDS